MTFGAESDEQVANQQLDRFVERGGNFLDTADVYADGKSEVIIGRWLAARAGARDRMVIATKARFPTGAGPNDLGLSRVRLTRALDASLRRDWAARDGGATAATTAAGDSYSDIHPYTNSHLYSDPTGDTDRNSKPNSKSHSNGRFIRFR